MPIYCGCHNATVHQLIFVVKRRKKANIEVILWSGSEQLFHHWLDWEWPWPLMRNKNRTSPPVSSFWMEAWGSLVASSSLRHKRERSCTWHTSRHTGERMSNGMLLFNRKLIQVKEGMVALPRPVCCAFYRLHGWIERKKVRKWRWTEKRVRGKTWSKQFVEAENICLIFQN